MDLLPDLIKAVCSEVIFLKCPSTQISFILPLTATNVQVTQSDLNSLVIASNDSFSILDNSDCDRGWRLAAGITKRGRLRSIVRSTFSTVPGSKINLDWRRVERGLRLKSYGFGGETPFRDSPRPNMPFNAEWRSLLKRTLNTPMQCVMYLCSLLTA